MRRTRTVKPNDAYHDSYYIQKLSQHGIFTAQAVGWTDYLQYRLFEKISYILDDCNPEQTYSLLDVGCGLGDYAHYLQNEKYTNIDYTGIDILPEMVLHARKKYPGNRFQHGDLLHLNPHKPFDFVISSGSLNILLFQNPEEHFNFVKVFIKKMYELCRYACSINLLSIHGKDFFPGNDRFYYADNAAVEDYCRSLCKKTEVFTEKHDYVFTICLLKKKLHKETFDQ